MADGIFGVVYFGCFAVCMLIPNVNLMYCFGQ